MILYEVNLDVQTSIYPDYRAWLDEHVHAMLTLPGFLSVDIYERQDPVAITGQRSLCVHYRVASSADLERYLREDAPRMRAEGRKRFPGQFSASRRILSLLRYPDAEAK